MSAPIEPSADDELQFNTTEPAVVAADVPVSVCARCKKPLGESYYAIGNHPLCAECRDVLQPDLKGGRPLRLIKAIGLGAGAALLGAVIWYAVRKIANMEIGLIAIVVGYLVGRAVRIGSDNHGGRAYQVIAVVLTYCGITANYVPDVASALWTADAGTPAAIGNAVRVVVFSLKLPFLLGFENIIGLLIIGFALWQAWKLNRRVALAITGPYRLGSGPGDGPMASLP